MNYYRILLPCVAFIASACTPIQPNISHQYKLERFSSRSVARQSTHLSLLISQPSSMAGYDTEQMLYMDKPYALSSFAHSAWISSPANMLYPLIIQSLEHSHYFFAIASGPDADKTDYRLDTQVIALQQNFLKRPSMLQLSIKVVLTHIQDNRIVASRLMTQDIACSEDTPYGGVVAANHAAYAFTDRLAKFVVHATQTDQITIK